MTKGKAVAIINDRQRREAAHRTGLVLGFDNWAEDPDFCPVWSNEQLARIAGGTSPMLEGHPQDSNQTLRIAAAAELLWRPENGYTEL